MDFSRNKNKEKNICSRCDKELGFVKHEPEISWGFLGKLCKDCFNHIKNSIQEYEAEYQGGYSKMTNKQKGSLLLYLYDNTNRIIFRNKNSIFIDIDSNSLISSEIVDKIEESRSRQILTAGLSKSKEKKNLKINFLESGQTESALFDLDEKKIFGVEKTISTFKKTTNLKSENRTEIFPIEYKHNQITSSEKFDEYEELEPVNVELNSICNFCHTRNDFEARFCSKCGTKLIDDSIGNTELNFEQYDSKKERVFFEDKGEIIVKKTEHRGSGRKVASWLVAGPIGYILIGKDKTRKSKAKGTLIVTNKAIYCAGNVYPYDKLTAITKQRRSILLLLDKDISGNRFSVTLELNSKDNKRLMEGLEMARTSHLYFQ